MTLDNQNVRYSFEVLEAFCRQTKGVGVITKGEID